MTKFAYLRLPTITATRYKMAKINHKTLSVAADEQGIKDIKGSWLDTSINGVSITNPDDEAKAISALGRMLSFQNKLNLIRNDNTFMGAYLFPIKHLVLMLTRLFKLSWNLGPDTGIKRYTVDCANTQLSQEQQLQVVNAFDPRIQTSINLTNMGMTQQTLEQLLSNVKGKKLHRLTLDGSDFSTMGDDENHPLIKAIQNNELKVEKLSLRGTQFNQGQLDALRHAMWQNTSVGAIRFDDSISKREQGKIKHITMRNRWIHKIEKENPNEILRLHHEDMTFSPKTKGSSKFNKFVAIKHLIEEGRYTKIEIAGTGKPKSATVEGWLEALKNNKDFTRLVYNDSSVKSEIKHKVRRQINVNRGVRKIFGKGNYLWSRSAMMFGLIGAQILAPFIAILAGPTALIAAFAPVIGFAISGGGRVLSNIFFKHSLDKAKDDTFWENDSNQDKYECGRQAAKSWSPWFNYKSWSTPGYLGYVHEQNGMESALKANKPKPKV